MNRSGHYSTTSWISNPLDWFINGVGLRRMFYIWVCDIEKVLGSRTDQHWFIFQNSHADSETIIRYEVSPCQVLVKWSKSESDHHHLIMAFMNSCLCCSLLSGSIIIGIAAAFLYGVAFAIELWMIIETDVSLSVPAYILTIGYLLMCLLSLAMILSLRWVITNFITSDL